MNNIVVGVDGSPSSVVAFHAAAREARLRGIGLDVVHAWTYPAAAVLPTSITMPTPDELVTHGNEIVDKALADAGLSPPEVGRHVVQGRAGPALVHLAADAALLVVGARGLSGFDALLLGSVSAHCVHHCHRPLLVARDGHAPADGDTIIVGVDGSEGSRRALQWAVNEARLRGAAHVEAIHAWHDPWKGAWPYPPPALDPADLAQAARQVLDRIVGAVDSAGLAAPVEVTLVNGAATPALLEAAERAALVVVGSRGHGALTGWALGSVSGHVARHSSRSVVIVP